MTRDLTRGAVVLVLVVLLGASQARAQDDKPGARGSAVIQDCIKSQEQGGWERCIGKLSEPCLVRDDARSTADMVTCSARERQIWDDILNETYRRLRSKLDDKQKIRLRDMQRAWIESRDRTCAFYWDYFQGTMASPMTAACMNRETARRALFLLGFLQDADAK